MRILVVDDDVGVLRAVCSVVRRFADVESALGAQVALIFLTAGQQFDVVISDVSMPGINGKQFLEKVRAKWPDLAERFIFLSGGGSTPELKRFIQEVPYFLPKPFGPDDIRRMVEKVVGRAI